MEFLSQGNQFDCILLPVATSCFVAMSCGVLKNLSCAKHRALCTTVHERVVLFLLHRACMSQKSCSSSQSPVSRPGRRDWKLRMRNEINRHMDVAQNTPTLRLSGRFQLSLLLPTKAMGYKMKRQKSSKNCKLSGVLPAANSCDSCGALPPSSCSMGRSSKAVACPKA